MSREKQIDEIAKLICTFPQCTYYNIIGGCEARKCIIADTAEKIYNAGYRKQSEGEWEWFEEWNPSTPEHPRECDDCGWRCGECKTALADIVGGYWDDPEEKPKLNLCPNCGANMR